MNQFLELIKNIISGLSFWFVVAPWEQAIRVRCGKHVKVFHAGFHWRIPYLDKVALHTTRLRFTSTGRQTLTTLDGNVVTVTVLLGYQINNLQRLFETLHHPEDTIRSIASSKMAEAVSRRTLEDCRNFELLSADVSQSIDLSIYGLSDSQVMIQEFVATRAYRLVGDYGTGSYTNGDSLKTTLKKEE